MSFTVKEIKKIDKEIKYMAIEFYKFIYYCDANNITTMSDCDYARIYGKVFSDSEEIKNFKDFLIYLEFIVKNGLLNNKNDLHKVTLDLTRFYLLEKLGYKMKEIIPILFLAGLPHIIHSSLKQNNINLNSLK